MKRFVVPVFLCWTVAATFLISLQEVNAEDTTPTSLRPDDEKRKANILLFDGGGSTGIMELAILDDVMRLMTILARNPSSLEYLTDNAKLSLDQKKLKEFFDDLSNVKQPIHPIKVFDMIVGTSTGGLIAFGLVGGNVDINGKRLPMPLSECIEMYLNNTGKIFEKSWLQWLVSAFTSRFVDVPLIPYSLDNLKKFLTGQFGDSTLRDFRDSESVAGVVAKKIGQKDDLVLLDTKSDIHKSYLTKQVLLATADAPVYSNTPVKIGHHEYIDGGVGGNYALAQAIPRAQEIFGDVKFVLSVAPPPSSDILSSYPNDSCDNFFVHQSTDEFPVFKDAKRRHKFVSFQRLTPRGDYLKHFKIDENNAQKMLDAVKEEILTNKLFLVDVIATAAFIFNAYLSKGGKTTEASAKVGAQLARHAGKIYSDEHKYEMAKDSFNTSLKLWNKVTEDNVKKFIAETEGELTESLIRLGKYFEASEHANFSLRNWKAFHNDKDHENVSYAFLVLGKSLHLSEKYKEASNNYELALKMQERIYGENAINALVASILFHMGQLNREKGKLDKAERLARKALLIQKYLYGKANHIDVARSLDSLGLCFTSQRKFKEGEQYLNDSLSMKKSLFHCYRSNPAIAASYKNLGWCLLRQQKHEAAQDHLQKALQLKTDFFAEDDHKSTALTLDYIATSMAYQGQHNAALERAQQALSMKKNLFGDVENPTIAQTLHTIGLCLVKERRFLDANKHLMKAVNIIENVFESKDHPDLVTFLTTLGDSFVGIGNYSDAKVHFDDALKIIDGKSGREFHPDVQDILDLLRKLADVSEKLNLEADEIYYSKRLERVKQQNGKGFVQFRKTTIVR